MVNFPCDGFNVFYEVCLP